MFKIEQTAKAALRDDAADSRHMPHEWKRMRGGMIFTNHVTDSESKPKITVKLAGEESNTENQRIWIALARECLRLAAGAK